MGGVFPTHADKMNTLQHFKAGFLPSGFTNKCNLNLSVAAALFFNDVQETSKCPWVLRANPKPGQDTHSLTGNNYATKESKRWWTRRLPRNEAASHENLALHLTRSITISSPPSTDGQGWSTPVLPIP